MGVMNRPIERCQDARSLCVMALGLLLFWGSGAWCSAEPEFPRDVEGVRTFLKQLTLDEESLAEIDAAVEQLDSDRFAQRYQASNFLRRLPVLPRERMERAAVGGSLEQRLRLSQVLNVNTPERTDAMIVTAMEAVMEGELRGLLPEIVAALDGRELASGWEACLGACEVTAVEADRELLKGALASKTVVVRGGGAAALIELGGKQVAAQLEPLVKDPDDRIKMIAADYLMAQRNPKCLHGYAALLLAEDFAVRWKSLDALRQITDQDFDYYASAKLEDRTGPAKDWMDWVTDYAETAKLNFDFEEPDENVLFNGKNLEGWKEVRGFFKRANSEQESWGVEDGTLICHGGAKGHLRTKAAYKDYLLKLKYRTPGGQGDSGVGLFLSGADKVEPVCLEVQLIYGRAGDLYQVGGLEAKGADGKAIAYRANRIAEPKEEKDGWNELKLRVAGGAVEVTVNGTVVNRASDCPTGETMVTLRNEGSRVEFREIVLSPLN